MRVGTSVGVGLLVAGAVVALAVAGGLPTVPSGAAAVEDTGDALGGWIWPFAAAMALLETAAPPITLVFPGEWALLLTGAVAGEGAIPIVPLVLLVWVCSAVGDSFAYLLGRRFGRAFLLRSGAPLGLTEDRLRRVDGWFDRHGAGAVALGRLVPFVRPTAPFLAGSTGFPYRRFLAWNALGTALFTLVFCLLGYFFYRSYDQVVAVVGRGGLVLLALLAVTGIAVSRRRRRGRRS